MAKFDYTNSNEDIFYKIIYPIYAKEFLFGCNYINFAKMLETKFILNSIQWQIILDHWNFKENILKES